MSVLIPQKPLWSAFNALSTAIVGRSPESFSFVPGKTPMSTLGQTAIALGIYYLVVFGGREIMRDVKAFKLEKINMVHNLCLTIISGVLLALFAEQLIPTLWNKGVFCAVCNVEDGWTDPLVVLYYLNYLTKYLEFLDTCFLFLKKKPLTFLHTYHHGATALLCFVQLTGVTPVSWVPITLNLAVHCVMYWYYFQAARGVKIWWKRYITKMQITQFVIDLGIVYYTTYNVLVSKHFPSFPHAGKCAGGTVAALTGCAILTSYLFLFIAFYCSTYKKKDAAASTSTKTSTNPTPTGTASTKASFRLSFSKAEALSASSLVKATTTNHVLLSSLLKKTLSVSLRARASSGETKPVPMHAPAAMTTRTAKPTNGNRSMNELPSFPSREITGDAMATPLVQVNEKLSLSVKGTSEAITPASTASKNHSMVQNAEALLHVLYLVGLGQS